MEEAFDGRRSVATLLSTLLIVLMLAACGGSDAESSGDGSVSADGSGDAGGGDDGASGNQGGETTGADAMATLTLGDEVYTWTGEDMNVCSIGGIFPANADFGVPPSQGGQGPWVQFIDRGDGGINFSALIDGQEYSGTGSGEADEIRSDGFTYTGSMGGGGERFEVQLEVTC